MIPRSLILSMTAILLSLAPVERGFAASTATSGAVSDQAASAAPAAPASAAPEAATPAAPPAAAPAASGAVESSPAARGDHAPKVQLPPGLIQPGGGVGSLGGGEAPATLSKEQLLLGKISDLLSTPMKTEDAAKATFGQVVKLSREYLKTYPEGRAAGNIVQLLMGLELMSGKEDDAVDITAGFFAHAKSSSEGLAAVQALSSYFERIEKPGKARALIERVLKENPEHPAVSRLRTDVVQILINSHEGAKALDLLAKLKATMTSPEDSDELAYFRGQSDLELSHHSPPEKAAQLRKQTMVEYESVLAKVRKEGPKGSALAPPTFMAAADACAITGDPAGALRYLSEMGKIYKDQEEAEIAQRMLMVFRLIGAKAHEFQGPGLTGQSVALKDFKGKLVLLDFWATWCGPCVEEIPHLARISRNARKAPLAIVSVSLDKPNRGDDLKKYVVEHKMSWSHVYDGKGWDSPIVKLYDVSSIPSIFLIDETGTVLTAGIRGHNLEDVVAAQIARLSGSPPIPAGKQTGAPGKGD